jgi:hypothetical protein
VLGNVNSQMEFDKYYILSDLLRMPNVRPQALTWLSRELILALRDPARLRGHQLELLYELSVVSALRSAFSAVLIVVLHPLTVQGWLSELPW